ncbi:putative malonyl-CoA-acyl carrier protein transacylase, mitochondrial [Frankliniella fusca]|uniref:Malonyl-CoA-acyl carrier protein transacylase, mitochondrial n=1 Tax=Frankliniella fusca TaxID=407009 RepID=A0AAE1HH05_9NEOP|nr:putative malonyl-CoA-acyl carrier protein transacylase, mitochondrial [Frankliniella fusca]
MITTRSFGHLKYLKTSVHQLHSSSSCLRRKKGPAPGFYLGHPSEISREQLKELLDNSAVGNRQKVGDQKWLQSPYAEENIRDQAKKALRPKVHPEETTIILFPGQGVQRVGMGKSLLKLPVVRDMFDCAKDILGYDLLKLCLEGPQNELDMTVYCQPAIYVTSLAALQLMLEERQMSVETCVATAGFSVGEYAALVLANALTFEEGLKLVKLRAEAMQRASEAVHGAMLTTFLDPGAKIGTILNSSIEYCRRTGVENPVCSVANFLYANCRVLGGNFEAIRFIEENSKDLKIKRCKRIPVSGAFHTDLMRPAAEEFAEELLKVKFKDPEISVHSNVDGLAYTDAKSIRKKLIKQIYRPVKWEQILHIIYDREPKEGFPHTFEVGPGKSLTSLLRYGNASASKHATNITV